MTIKNRLHNLYLWFLRLFKKPMDYSKSYNELVQLRNSAFINCDTFFEKEQPKGYLSKVKRDDENGMYEFKIGQFRFITQAEVLPHSRQILYKTFLRTIDLVHYPNLVYINEHLDIDIVGSGIYSIHIFVKEQQQASSFIGYDNRVPSKDVGSFCEVLIDQIEQILIKRYPIKSF